MSMSYDHFDRLTLKSKLTELEVLSLCSVLARFLRLSTLSDFYDILLSDSHEHVESLCSKQVLILSLFMPCVQG